MHLVTHLPGEIVDDVRVMVSFFCAVIDRVR